MNALEILLINSKSARYQNEIEPQSKQKMKRLTNDLNRYKQVISHNKLHTENEKLANDLNRNKQNKYQQEIEPKYTEKINNLNNNLDRHQHEINTLNNNISCSKANYGLEAINDKLRKEASSYQLALEDTLYFHLSDENNSARLSTDINSSG
ncbi:18057_t:CDS:2 [Entrophospora sp. SA101]|nr:18057_t:CDS:2 [Entrophospora sp. SA101]